MTTLFIKSAVTFPRCAGGNSLGSTSLGSTSDTDNGSPSKRWRSRSEKAFRRVVEIVV